MFTWALLAYVAAMLAHSLLASLTTQTGGFAMDTRGEVVRMVAMTAPVQISTAVVEEILVVAVPVVLLGAARRPTWEIYTVACLAKVSYHLYYGWAILPLALGAAVLVWLYRRTTRLTPLITAHLTYNLGYSALLLATATHLPTKDRTTNGRRHQGRTHRLGRRRATVRRVPPHRVSPGNPTTLRHRQRA
ncbi:CPBP family intramembrane glutamic endopeptidase [Salinactinospora qingdaonensis]|uniref:CPBP family intramembrane glutamic endopeptidase n=1 Tax=Salinactinospora qingdaonensis TaxID=702744 RepID=UPI0031E92B3E